MTTKQMTLETKYQIAKGAELKLGTFDAATMVDINAPNPPKIRRPIPPVGETRVRLAMIGGHLQEQVFVGGVLAQAIVVR